MNNRKFTINEQWDQHMRYEEFDSDYGILCSQLRNYIT